MSDPISALELKPGDLVREVSADSVKFYVDELSGIYLPSDFQEEHADITDVKFWKPEDRLSGKFGRFALRKAQEDGETENEPVDEILLMGPTIGVAGLDRYRDMHSLYHRDLRMKMREVLVERDMIGKSVAVDEIDYGSTHIKLGDHGEAEMVSVGGKSFDFGRASTEGRQATCEVFEQLLGTEIQVLNSEPEPRDFDRIVG